MTRFLAKLIDWVLLGVVLGVVWFAIIVGVLFSAASTGRGLGSFIINLLGAVVITGIVIGYFAFMESSRGQTVGKMLLKLEVRGSGGGKPTMEEAVKRNAYNTLYLLNAIPFVGWLLSSLGLLAVNIYIAIGINNDVTTRRGWHDQFAGNTTVYKVG
ncbi:MAG: RDD family protein [Nitriliruptoraceae bacterium]